MSDDISNSQPKPPQLANLSARDISVSIAKSLGSVGKSIGAYQSAETGSAKNKQLGKIERELESTIYWLSMLSNDAKKSGPILNRVLNGATDVLDLTVSALRVYKNK